MPELGAPAWLVLLPVPFLALWLRAAARRRSRMRTGEALIHPMAGVIAGLQGPPRPLAAPWLWLAGCVLLVLALARPQWHDPNATIASPVHDVVFAIDVSGSMRAMDYAIDGQAISRLDMVKRSLKRFLERRAGLRAGLIVFADDALTLMPLTADLALAASMTDAIDNSLAGERTAIGDAIALATRRMEQSPGKARLLVVLTDGGDTASAIDPPSAAARARELGMRIHTIGFGRAGPVPFPLGSGETTWTELPLDEPALQAIAAAGDGQYFSVAEAGDMDRILERIHEIEQAQVPLPRGLQEWHWLPALLGLLLLLIAEYRRQREVAPA